MKYSIVHPKDLNDYYHAFNSMNIQYFESLKKYLMLTKNVKGEILEFGVGRGRSLIVTAHLINQYNFKKKFNLWLELQIYLLKLLLSS